MPNNSAPDAFDNAPEMRYVPRLHPVASTARNRSSQLALTRRGQIPHWDVPPAFENPRQALMELGVERYKEAVKSYYETIRELGVANAHIAHSRWVVRQCVRHFETQIRRFRRFNGANGPQGQLISPLDLYKSSRMLWDLRDTLSFYQVPRALHAATESAIRAKLETLWGLES